MLNKALLPHSKFPKVYADKCYCLENDNLGTINYHVLIFLGFPSYILLEVIRLGIV